MPPAQGVAVLLEAVQAPGDPGRQQPSAAVPRAGVMPRSLRSVIKADPGSPHSRAGTYYRPDLFMPPQRHRRDTGWWEGREGSHLPRLLSAWSSRSGNGVYGSGLPTHESRLRLPPSDPSPLCRKHPPTLHPQGAARVPGGSQRAEPSGSHVVLSHPPLLGGQLCHQHGHSGLAALCSSVKHRPL